MNRKLRKVHGLLRRYQFVDLAKAIAVPMPRRKDHLRTYLDRALLTPGKMASYEFFRRAVPDIYGVIRPLDPSPAVDIGEIVESIRANCHKDDVARNIEVAKLLYGFVRPRGYICYDHAAHDLPISTTRKVQIRVNHFVVEKDRGIFQFVYPRKDALTGEEIQLMGSLIHHNYVQGDYAEADVEIVDLSCPDSIGPKGGSKRSSDRLPRIHAIRAEDVISRSELAPHVQSVHDMLLEIGGEPDS